MWEAPGLCRECGRPTYRPVERAALDRVKPLDSAGQVVLAALLDGPPLPAQAVRLVGWLVQGAREGVRAYELAGAIGYRAQSLNSRFQRIGLPSLWFYLNRVRLTTASYFGSRGGVSGRPQVIEQAAYRAEYSSASDLCRAIRRAYGTGAAAWLRRPFRTIAAETRAELFPDHHLTLWLDRPLIVERLTCDDEAEDRV